MDTQTKVEFVVSERVDVNTMQEKLVLDITETHVRTAAEALDEALRNAQQNQRRGVARTVFVP